MEKFKRRRGRCEFRRRGGTCRIYVKRGERKTGCDESGGRSDCRFARMANGQVAQVTDVFLFQR